MSGRVRFHVGLGQSAPRSRGSLPRRVLILADLGAETRTVRLADRKILAIDVDNFDEVVARVAPRLRISLDDTPESKVLIEIRQLDDFHPDALFRQLPVFTRLREMRRRLESPASFRSAAEELRRGLTNTGEPSVPPEPDTASAGPEGPTASLFETLLGEAPPEAPSATIPQQDFVRRLIRQIAEPHLSLGVNSGEQRQWLSVLDDAISRLMCRILHDPAFQKLEATWRAIHWLLSRIEDGESLGLFVLDVAEAELAADLTAADGAVEHAAIYHLLAGDSIGVPDGDPWSLVIGDYTFGASADTLDILELLGAVSAGCGGVFIGAASPALVGCASLTKTPDVTDWSDPSAALAERWQSLRRSPLAHHIGLALPRYMLRLPYGKRSDPIDSFSFEELPPHTPHESYLWGNPAFACGFLIANAWLQVDDLDDPPGTLREIDDLPYQVVDDGGEQTMKPCAEVYLNERTAHAILDRGIAPLLSVKHRNLVLVPRLQSVSGHQLELWN